MKFVHEAILRAFPHFNRRAATFEDVKRYVKRSSINLRITKYNPEVLGYFCLRRTQKRTFRWIVINSDLHRLIQLYVGLHEIGHHILNPPTSARTWRYCRLTAERCESKHDAQADYFALIAMVPTAHFIELEETGCEDIPEELFPIIKKRKRIWDLYGL